MFPREGGIIDLLTYLVSLKIANYFKYLNSNLDILSPYVETSLMAPIMRFAIYMYGSVSYFFIEKCLIFVIGG